MIASNQQGLPKTLQVYVIRDFYYNQKRHETGESIELPYLFAREMLAARKVSQEPLPEPTPVDNEAIAAKMEKRARREAAIAAKAASRTGAKPA